MNGMTVLLVSLPFNSTISKDDAIAKKSSRRFYFQSLGFSPSFSSVSLTVTLCVTSTLFLKTGVQESLNHVLRSLSPIP